MNAKWLVLLVVALFAMVPAAMAAEKRCKAEGVKVECPTQTKEALEKAAENYDKEAMDMLKGRAGSTYGITGFDYLTGVGKRSSGSKAGAATLEKGDSGYSKGTGKTEMWDRYDKMKKTQAFTGDSAYNLWTNAWSPSFKTSLVPGANPNEGKQWFYFYCVHCHGWLLHGDGPTAIRLDPYPRNLTAGAAYMNKKTNVELFTVIKGGGVAGELSDAMPAWGNLLQDQDIWNIVAWIRANADTKKPSSLEEYLNPKSSFDPKSSANAVTPLNAAKSAEFNEAQEMLEAMLAGRGGDELKGGGFVDGGLRRTADEESKRMK